MKKCFLGSPNPLFILYEGEKTFCGKGESGFWPLLPDFTTQSVNKNRTIFLLNFVLSRWLIKKWRLWGGGGMQAQPSLPSPPLRVFFSITWRMISRSAGYKIHFWKQPPFWGNFVRCRCDVFRFFEFILLGNSSSTAPVFSYNQTNK